MLLAGTAAVALAAASTATFDATLTVTQDLTWTQNVSARSCDGGIFEIRGNGESHLRVRTTRRQVAIARRVRGSRKATLGFARGSSLVPVTGTLTRTGTRSFGPTQGGSGERCGQPLPGPAPR